MLVNWLYEATIYSSALIVIMLVSQILHARLWLKEYPEPIRAAAAPMSGREKLAKRLLDMPLVVIKAGYPVFSSFVNRAALGQSYTLLVGFAHLLVLFSVFILIDLLVLDGLIFCLITPRFVVIGGTEDLKSAYKDFRFHARKALGDFGLSVMFSALVAGALAVLK